MSRRENRRQLKRLQAAPAGDTPAPTVRETKRDATIRWIRERGRCTLVGWGTATVAILLLAGLLATKTVNPSPLATKPTSFGTAGANVLERGALPDDVEIGVVGHGQSTTYVIKKKGVTTPQPAVVFLHGFGFQLVAGYEPWLTHLAREGLTVIFPTWQQPPYPIDGSQDPRKNMFDGVRAAIKAVPISGSTVSVIGLSAGGALSLDYAANYKENGVPMPSVVEAVYPGRALPGETKPLLPMPSAAGINPLTNFITFCAPKDQEVGCKWAIAQSKVIATVPGVHQRLIIVTNHTLQDHYSIGKGDPIERFQFWEPFDKRLAATGVALKPDTALVAATAAGDEVQREVTDNGLVRGKALDLQSALDALNRDPTAGTGTTPN